MAEINTSPELSVSTLSERIVHEVSKAVVGKQDVLYAMIAAFLSEGHVLLEDYPGLAKTLIANSFASALGLTFRRIQFTPDLLPGDITGGYIYDRAQSQFILRKGPLFAHIVLADEINRASPRTQSALLEAMQERQVTVEGETMKLPEPFIVIATQNPIEYEGTFPLPEAQLDRFMLKLAVGYPSAKKRRKFLHRRRERRTEDQIVQVVAERRRSAQHAPRSKMCLSMPTLSTIIVSLTSQNARAQARGGWREPARVAGAAQARRAWAAIRRRRYVLPDDVKRFVKPALNYRLILRPGFVVGAAGRRADFE